MTCTVQMEAQARYRLARRCLDSTAERSCNSLQHRHHIAAALCSMWQSFSHTIKEFLCAAVVWLLPCPFCLTSMSCTCRVSQALAHQLRLSRCG